MEFFLLVHGEYMAHININENIVTRKFLTQFFANEISTNYGNLIIT